MEKRSSLSRFQCLRLDVSNKTALTDLECGFNQLTAVDVSNNTALTTENCQVNQLTSLDVSNNGQKNVATGRAVRR